MAVADKLNKGERQRTWKACLTSAALYIVAWHIVVVATALNAYVRWHHRRSHVDVCDVNLREIAGLNVHVRGLFGSGLRFNKQNHLPGYHIVGRCYRNFTFLLLWQRNLKNTGTSPVHFGSTFWPWKNLQVSLNVKQYHCQQKWNWMHKQFFPANRSPMYIYVHHISTRQCHIRRGVCWCSPLRLPANCVVGCRACDDRKWLQFTAFWLNLLILKCNSFSYCSFTPETIKGTGSGAFQKEHTWNRWKYPKLT